MIAEQPIYQVPLLNGEKPGFQRYTLVRVLTKTWTLVLLGYFLLMQVKWEGYFLGSILYLGLGFSHFVFFCFPHSLRLKILRSTLAWIAWAGISLGVLTWHIVYIVKMLDRCGPPHHYCSYEMAWRVPALGWGMMANFVI